MLLDARHDLGFDETIIALVGDIEIDRKTA